MAMIEQRGRDILAPEFRLTRLIRALTFVRIAEEKRATSSAWMPRSFDDEAFALGQIGLPRKEVIGRAEETRPRRPRRSRRFAGSPGPSGSATASGSSHAHERHACGLAGLHHGLRIAERGGEGLLHR